MTKKDFKKFAEMIVELEKNYPDKNISIEQIENRIVKILTQDNYRFDWDKWESYKKKVKKR